MTFNSKIVSQYVINSTVEPFLFKKNEGIFTSHFPSLNNMKLPPPPTPTPQKEIFFLGYLLS